MNNLWHALSFTDFNIAQDQDECTYNENYVQKFILGKIELDQDHTHILMSNFLVNKNSIPNIVIAFACSIFDPPARFINV